MILVDTSIWIATFRATAPIDRLDYADIDEVVICLPVLQEVLHHDRDFEALGRVSPLLA